MVPKSTPKITSAKCMKKTMNNSKKGLNIFVQAFLIFYSVLNANTGSFFAAFFEGISPPINVKTTLNIINVIAPLTGNTAVIPILFVSL